MTDLATTGLELRRRVLGAEYADGSIERAVGNPRAEALQDLVNQYVWGSVWSRSGFDLKYRSIATLTVLAIRGQTDELVLHLKAALRNGLTAEELEELFIHLGAYAGIPVANYAFRVMREAGVGSDEPAKP